MSAKDAPRTEPRKSRADSAAAQDEKAGAGTGERADSRKDVQERRLQVKGEAVALAAYLAGYRARTRVGKVTAQRATVEVRQESRPRYDVVVTVEDGEPVYTIAAGRDAGEYLERDALRATIIAPAPRWQKWWVLGLTLVLWGLVAIGVAVLGKEESLLTRNQAYWVLPTIFVAGVLLTYALRSLVTRARRAGRMRRAAKAILSRG